MFEVKALDVETFCAFETRPNVTNSLVTGCIFETALQEKHIYKKMKVSFSSTLSRYFVAAPVVSDSIARAFNRSETIRALVLGILRFLTEFSTLTFFKKSKSCRI